MKTLRTEGENLSPRLGGDLPFTFSIERRDHTPTFERHGIVSNRVEAFQKGTQNVASGVDSFDRFPMKGMADELIKAQEIA